MDSNSQEDIDKKDIEVNEKVHNSKTKKWILFTLIGVITSCVILIAIILPLAIKARAEQDKLAIKKDSHMNMASNTTDPIIPSSSNTARSVGNEPTEPVRSIQNDLIINGLQQDKKTTTAQLGNKKTRLVTPQNLALFHPPTYAHAVSPYSRLTRMKILEPATESRIFIMGDVHGCLKEMNQLLEETQFEVGKDVLILAGDLIFRGEDSIGVIRRAREIGAYCVRGNHDDKVVRLKTYEYTFGLDAMRPKHLIMPEGNVGDPLKFGNKHTEISKELTREDYEYLKNCPLILDVPSLNARVVHAGLDPALPNVVDNDPWSVMNMRNIDRNKRPSKLKLNKKPNSQSEHWAVNYQLFSQQHQNNVTVYYGHDASRGVTISDQTVGVDSGCVYGRKLSAIEIKSKSLTQVDCSTRGDSIDEDDDH